MRCIGKYKLLGLLGRGGMGSVYKVMDPAQKNLGAMKVLRPSRIMLDIAGFEVLKKRFLKESHIMKQLKNRHVADVYEVGEHGGLPYMVQEYLCLNLGLLIGESSRAEVPTRPLSPLKSLEMITQVLAGLSGIHESGLIYRDIKPENIMLSRSGEVKIIDFGLSRFIHDQEQLFRGMIIGSPYYAAPEQIDNPERADQRSDIYSVGVVLHRMVTGHLPEMNEVDVSGHSLLGSGWHSLLKTALAVNPDHRFPNAAAMCREVLKLKLNWKNRQVQVCALPGGKNKNISRKFWRLRSRPLHTGGTDKVSLGDLNSLMQPEVYIDNKFQQTEKGVLDHATGLTWAKDTSSHQLNFEQSLEYIGVLNQQDITRENTDQWRLPTIEELISLLGPRQRLDDFCGPDLWHLKNQPWLWSADSQTRTKAWIVDMDQGAVLAQDRMCRFHVLPVRQNYGE